MSALTSTCIRHFGHADFDLSRVAPASPSCPVRDCSEPLVKVLSGKQHDSKGAPPKERTKLWCPVHGIRLHSGTFVYWNGPDTRKKSQLRNLIVEPDLASRIPLKPGAKAEADRFGHEMSEDALSWNVFVSLAVAARLKDAGEWLTGRRLSAEPELYLWGKRIDPVDVKNNERGTYEALQQVRDNLEKGIKRFVTEPDIMLVVKDEMVICIEAKFGSGNSLAHEGTIKDGEKPTSRVGLLARYLGSAMRDRTKAIIRPEYMAQRLHGQLFRNVVFASEMADKDWHVVNLVSRKQHRDRKENASCSFTDPTDDVRSYLSPESKSCFTYCTWEDLYAEIVRDRTELAELGRYMRDMSAHYRPAFDLV
jgi:hypothetical protein